jgi:hypothetical protein
MKTMWFVGIKCSLVNLARSDAPPSWVVQVNWIYYIFGEALTVVDRCNGVVQLTSRDLASLSFPQIVSRVMSSMQLQMETLNQRKGLNWKTAYPPAELTRTAIRTNYNGYLQMGWTLGEIPKEYL